MNQALEMLLQKLVEGPIDDDLLVQARAAVHACEGIPEEIRDDVLVDAGSAGADAELLLSLLGVSQQADRDLAEALQPGPVDVVAGVMQAISGIESLEDVGEAVREEAGEVRVDRDVLTDLAMPVLQGVGEAVREEGGAVDVVPSVLSELDLESGLTVGEAVRSEAGSVELVSAVMATLELSGIFDVGDAVREEAGTVDVVPLVTAEVASTMGGGMPAQTSTIPNVPPAANRTFTIRALALAAAAMLVVAGGAFLGGGAVLGGHMLGTSNPGELPTPVTSLGSDVPELVFASAADVVVEDLSFGEGVQVFQTEGDDGAMVLWIEEEVL